MTAYLTRIWQLRFFWGSLVRIDLRKRYRRSALGIGWSLLHPLAMACILCIVFSRIFHNDYRSFLPFLLTGLTFWQFFQGATSQGCNCFLVGEPYIRQHPAPLAIYPLRTTLGVGVHFLIGLAIVLPFVWWTRGFGDPLPLISLLPTLALLLLLGWSVALCIGVINVLFHDTQHLVDVFLQMLFYLTPVIYPPGLMDGRQLNALMAFNPLAAFLDLVRTPILQGQFPSLASYAIAVGTTLAAVSAATLMLLRLERRLIFYL